MFKISSFFEHYLEHKNSDESIDFIDFIRLHYSDENHTEKHDENNLPFKQHHDFSFISKLFKINFSKKVSSEFITFHFIKKSFVINNENQNSSLLNTTIWQPPKF
jgi:hypothetical protein